MGESRYLVSGALYDQPASDWYAAQRAGYVDYLLTTQSKPNFKMATSGLDDSAQLLLLELNELSRELRKTLRPR